MGKEKEPEISIGQSTEIKCLAECPKCLETDIEGLCADNLGHACEHRCNQCSNTWG